MHSRSCRVFSRKFAKQIPKLAANGGEMMDALSQNYVTEEVCGMDLVARGYSPLGVG